jgi:protoporphyrinogen/coproporphyrinogen III oxidase
MRDFVARVGGMSAERTTVLVVGGGLTGLALAHVLAERGTPVTVLEAGERVGGNIRTKMLQRTEGTWLLDLGPNSFGEKSEAFVGLARSVGLENRIVRASDAAKRRYVWRGGALRLVSPRTVLFTSGLLPFLDRMRLLREPFVGRRREAGEETLAAFCDRRLGRAAREKLLTPVVGGIYAGNPVELGAESAFPAMVALEREYGSLIRAAVRGKGPSSRGRLCSFVDGLSELPDALGKRLGKAIVTGARAARIGWTRTAWRVTTADGREFDARQLAVTVPAAQAAEMLSADKTLAGELAAIPYAPMAVVHVGLRVGALLRAPPGFGFLVPRDEGLRILGAIFSSALFEGRAPAGYSLLTVFIGGRLDPEAPSLSDRELRDHVVADLRRALRLVDEPLFCEITRWPRAIPQYVVGHKDRIARIDAACRAYPGLHLLGNWRGGIAMPDCVRNARALAETIAASPVSA